MEKKLNNVTLTLIYIVLVFSLIFNVMMFLTYIFDLFASHLFDYVNYLTTPLLFYSFCLLTFFISTIKGFMIINKFNYDEKTCEDMFSIFLIYSYGTIVYNIFNIVLLCIKMESLLIYFYVGFGVVSIIISILLFAAYKHVKKTIRGENNENK